MKYRIIAGKHTVKNEDGTRTRFAKGSVIESDKPLDEIHENKFERVRDDEETSEPEAVNQPRNTKSMNTQAEKREAREKEDAKRSASDDEGSSPADEEAEGSEEGKEAGEESSADEEADEDQPEITLKAIHRGRGNWDVVKVINGVETEENVNEAFLKKAAAKEMEEAGWPIPE